jgi:poly-beta-1,6-N-acetyl-D-glucosamine synthase
MIISLLSIILWSYLILMVLTIIGWSKKRIISDNKNHHFISVIIPFRNEESDLKACIESVLKNKTAPFELLLVDDHSEDNSLAIALSYEEKFNNVSVLKLSDTTGKKAAIKLAIEQAKGKIVLQTDADCVVQSSWISSMACEFKDEIKLLIGPVKVTKTDEYWNWFNQIEFGFLQAFTGAAANFSKPIMANGANLMYSKKTYWEFEESKLGAQYASGDDQFLLNHVKSHHPNSIKYVNNQKSIVSTVFSSDWKDMVKQRSRWAKKKSTSNGVDLLIGLLLLSSQFLLPTCLILSFFESEFIKLFWTVFVLKVGFEFALASIFMPFFNIKGMKYIPLFTILYPFFITKVILLVRNHTNHWKGREI